MGALRAYELRDYGMLGYGKVYQDYLEGILDGDDEVAISYFPSSNGLNKTIAMVNIRTTLKKLHIYDKDLIFKIRKIHFKQRNWLTLKAVVPNEIFFKLNAHYIDQKKEDVLLYFQNKCIKFKRFIQNRIQKIFIY